ncbi:MAG: hypothetical protein ACRELF_23405 [Gemmataceae bacterium]
MQTDVHKIADRVYRLLTFMPDAAPVGFTFNLFLIDGDESPLAECGGTRHNAFEPIGDSRERVPFKPLRAPSAPLRRDHRARQTEENV